MLVFFDRIVNLFELYLRNLETNIFIFHPFGYLVLVSRIVSLSHMMIEIFMLMPFIFYW